jgi:hypothetical protein
MFEAYKKQNNDEEEKNDCPGNSKIENLNRL